MKAPQLQSAGGCVGHSHSHESAALHVSGEATYTDDIPELQGTLHAALGLSPVAHGRLLSIDLALLRAQPGVVAVLTAADIPGENNCGPLVHDDPILAGETLSYLGQPVFAVIASSRELARRAAALAKTALQIEALPAVLTAKDAHAQGHYVLPPMHLSRGDAAAALAAAPLRLSGEWSVGGQEQFYLEGQISYAVPQESQGLLVHCSTQHPSEMQQLLAHALGWASHQVQVQCRRMGGGFGGKESQSALFACVAALAATKLRRPVKLRLDRDDDFMITGRRHGFDYRWDVGFDEQGRILGAEVDLISNCGHSADLSAPVMARALCHFDNAYYLPHVALHGFCARTHTQSNTAFRGFGGPQGALAIEMILDAVARRLQRDPLQVRLSNLYADEGGRNITPYGQQVEDNILAPLIDRLQASSDYAQRRQAVSDFNARSPVLKKGLALTPLKFGISFNVVHLNQAGALVHVYTDGSVLVNHGGTEMGQGLNTKVAQVVAHELGLSLARVRCSATDTQKIANTSATAASTGSDLNGKAAQDAAARIKSRLGRAGGAAVAMRGGRGALCGRAGQRRRSIDEFCRTGAQSLYAAGAAVERGLLRHARPALGPRQAAGQAVLLLRLRRRRFGSLGRHAHRRKPRHPRRCLARCGPLTEPRAGHRPDRGRFCAGHGLADDGRTGLAPQQRRPAHPRAQHLQNPYGERQPAGFPRGLVRPAECSRQHPPLQSGGRAAAALADLGAAGHQGRCRFNRPRRLRPRSARPGHGRVGLASAAFGARLG